MKNIFYILLILTSCSLNAQTLEDEQIIENHVPAQFLSIDSGTKIDGVPQKLKKDEVAYRYISYNFNDPTVRKYLIVNYNYSLKSKDALAYFKVIKVNKNGTSISLPEVDIKVGWYEFEMQLLDLNGDGINEILTENFGDRGGVISNSIFQWKNGNLVDITPMDPTPDLVDSLFKNLSITNHKINNSLLLINQGETSTTSYLLGANGFATESASFLAILEKKEKKPLVENYNLPASNITTGTYTIEIKNISNHKKNVRAEISINGSIVIKPEDFCVEKPKPKPKHNNNKHDKDDDDDDGDDDGCKRCKPKNIVYADVQLNATNTMTVKLYGKKKSVIQVSLKKKN